jgi:hypothetical protein
MKFRAASVDHQFAWYVGLLSLLALTLPLELGAQSPSPATDSGRTPPTCEPENQVIHTGPSSLGGELLRIAEIRGKTGPHGLRALRRGFDESSMFVCGGRRLGARAIGPPIVDGRPAWRLTPITSRLIVNSAYSVDRANGPLRGAKGASVGLTAGVEARWGPISAKVSPFIGHESNSDLVIYDTTFSNRSRFAYPWTRGLDWPQRFGDEPYQVVDIGESFVRGDFGPIGAGISNEILVWGASRRYPILLGDAAPGFPHLFLGFNAPMNVGIGTLDIQLMAATLSESAFFNDDPADNGRRFSALFTAFQPSGVKGLTIGAARTFDGKLTGRQSALDLLTNPLELGQNPVGNALNWFFFRWVMQDSGFELYGEWTRADVVDTSVPDVDDPLVEADRSSSWTVGFQKTAETGLGLLRVGFEMTDLKPGNTTINTRDGSSLVPDRVYRGQTNDGQLLGGWTGPGSDAEFLQVDIFRERTRYGIFFERVRRDDDTYERAFVFDFSFRGHDIEFIGGTRASARIGAFLLDATASISHRKNRRFIGLFLGNRDFLRENNAVLDVTLSFLPGRLSGWRSF